MIITTLRISYDSFEFNTNRVQNVLSIADLRLFVISFHSNLKKGITDYSQADYIEWVLDHSGQVVIAVVNVYYF